VLKYTFYLIFTIFILSSLSCNRVQSKLNNASNQIENAQQNIKEMNSSDWSELKNTMTELEDHFESNKDNYSDEQVKEIGRIQGKYAALLVKKGINDFQESLKDLGNQVEGLVEGITDTTNTKNK
jgi:gas vesicle protein